MVNTVVWPDLPDDVLSKIATCLDCRIDVLRIRGVCQSWRSSLRRYMDTEKTLTPLHKLLEIPGPYSRRIKRANQQIDRKLSQTTVYRIQPKGESEGPNSAQVWFLKLEELGPNQMRILNPLSYFRSKSLPSSFPKVLNLLDYSITQISTGYAIKDLEKYHDRKSSFMISTFSHKAVLYPDSIWTPLEDLTIFMLRQKGSLYYCKPGDEKWIRINDKGEKLSDIVVYKNKLYVVNRWGEVWTIDSAMKMIKHTPPLYDGGTGNMKQLVISNGQLKLLDKHVIYNGLSESDDYVEDTLDEEEGRDDTTQSCEDDENAIDMPADDEDEEANDDKGQKDMKDEPMIVGRYEMCCCMGRNELGLEVYNLDEDLGRWVEAENLGGEVWFIANESIFCLKTEELPGFKSDCMYLLKQNLDNDDEDMRLSETGVTMFQMGKRRRRKRRMRKVQSFPGPALMFWPPSPVPSTSSCS